MGLKKANHFEEGKREKVNTRWLVRDKRSIVVIGARERDTFYVLSVGYQILEPLTESQELFHKKKVQNWHSCDGKHHDFLTKTNEEEGKIGIGCHHLQIVIVYFPPLPRHILGLFIQPFPVVGTLVTDR